MVCKCLKIQQDIIHAQKQIWLPFHALMVVSDVAENKKTNTTYLGQAHNKSFRTFECLSIGSICNFDFKVNSLQGEKLWNGFYTYLYNKNDNRKKNVVPIEKYPDIRKPSGVKNKTSRQTINKKLLWQKIKNNHLCRWPEKRSTILFSWVHVQALTLSY